MAMLHCLELSSLFTIPSHLLCQWSLRLCKESARSPGRIMSESMCEGAIATRRLLLCRIVVQTLLPSTGAIPSPNVGGCFLSKANTASPGRQEPV